jgi:secernin
MCDTWVALRDATQTEQVILAKNSDRPIFDCQPLLFYPRQDWPAASQIKLTYITIPQVPTTYTTLGSSPYWCWGYEEGINEHSVVIGNEAIFTKTFRTAATYTAGQPVELGILGMDLIRLTLERSRTAGEAVGVMGALIEQYGQFGSGVPTKAHAEGGYDGSFMIADPQEAWIVEAVGQRWVARQVTRGTASISNQPTIRTQWERGSTDIVDYATMMGWWPAEQGDHFDFARAYIDETKARQVAQIRAMRSRQLLAERAGQITPEWMQRIARDHYEETFLGGPTFDPADPDFHTLCMHVSPADFTWGNTASSCVAVLPKTPEELPVFWWTPGPPCNGCYVPFFVHGRQLPSIVSNAGRFGKQVMPPPQVEPDTFLSTSYWWLFRELLDRVKGDAIYSKPRYYPVRNPVVRRQFDQLEQQFAAELSQVMQLAVTARSGGEEERAASILDAFTAQCVERVVAALTVLLNEFNEPIAWREKCSMT